jgi:hypothetical protein
LKRWIFVQLARNGEVPCGACRPGLLNRLAHPFTDALEHIDPEGPE